MLDQGNDQVSGPEHKSPQLSENTNKAVRLAQNIYRMNYFAVYDSPTNTQFI